MHVVKDLNCCRGCIIFLAFTVIRSASGWAELASGMDWRELNLSLRVLFLSLSSPSLKQGNSTTAVLLK